MPSTKGKPAAHPRQKLARRGKLLLLGSLLLVVAPGCAVGVRHDYRRAAPVVHAGPGPFGVGVHDQRAYVVAGTSDPAFVGVQRGGYGNPFDVHTQSGEPLADDFTVTLENALGNEKTDTVTLRPGLPRPVALNTLRQTRADRLVLLTLYDWQSDTYNNTSLYFDVSVEVFDDEARRIAHERFKGEEALGGSVWNPPAHARSAIPEAYQNKLQQFFAAPDISAALQSTGPAPPSADSEPPVADGALRASGSQPVQTRLEELEELRASGLINNDEYKRKRDEILSDL